MTTIRIKVITIVNVKKCNIKGWFKLAASLAKKNVILQLSHIPKGKVLDASFYRMIDITHGKNP